MWGVDEAVLFWKGTEGSRVEGKGEKSSYEAVSVEASVDPHTAVLRMELSPLE